MLHPFGPDAFMHRPLQVMLVVAHVEPTRLPGRLRIHEAVHLALLRPRDSRYEPIVIGLEDGDVRMLGVNELLPAQSRLLEMANETIRRQKEAADAANVAKSLFLANMSHEIRTPMNGILGMRDLLLEAEVHDVQREYLPMVKSSADRLVSVINDILGVSKIAAGKLDLEQIRFDLRDVIGDLMKMLAFRAHDKELELACRIVPGVPQAVIGDPVRLRQVLTNLVGNAIQPGNCPEVRRNAHSLKGSAALFAAEQVQQSARQLEEIAAAGDRSRARPVFRDLEARLQALLPERGGCRPKPQPLATP